MTLKEAYDKWGKEVDNKILAMRYLNANNRCVLNKWGSTPLEQVDRNFIFQLFAKCKEGKELKAKAASTIVYVMRYVFDKKLIPDCKPVNYDYNDIMNEQVTANNSVSKKVAKVASEAPAPVYEETGEVKMKSDVVSSETSSVRGSETTVPNATKSRHPKAREVAIINPETKEVIHRFPSVSNAEKTCAVRNIDRYCRKRRPLKGVWWAYMDELDDWVAGVPSENNQKLKEKKQKTVSVVDRRKKKVMNNNKEEKTLNHQEKTVEEAAPVAVAAETEQPKVFSIEDVSTEELIAECRRRGWTGDFYVHFKL